jgi:hypothetical protein
MICDNCKIDRSDSDFINNQKFCFRCEYQKKMEKIPRKKIQKPALCRMCGSPITHEENSKKRQRTIFCSPQCAEEGHKELNSSHWVRLLRSRRIDGF